MSIPFLDDFNRKQAARGRIQAHLLLSPAQEQAERTSAERLAGQLAERLAPPAEPSTYTRTPRPAPLSPVAAATISRAKYREPAAPRLDPAVRALEYTRSITEQAECPKTARRILGELLGLAVKVLKARRYEGLPSVVEFFAPAELLIDLLDVDKTTFYRNLKPLIAAGWIDHQAHYGNVYGTRSKDGQKASQKAGGSEARADGTCWAVRLIPGHSAARVTASFLRLEHRNLSYDKKTGNTVYNTLKELNATVKDKSLKAVEVRKRLEALALPPVPSDHPPLHMTVAPGLEGIYDGLQLPHLRFSERGPAVDALARLVAVMLGDTVNVRGQDNTNVYRWIFWRLLRLHDSGIDPESTNLRAVLDMVDRAVQDSREEFARRAGALLMSRLKASGIWRTLAELPDVRVANRPARPQVAA